jgi:ribonuclease BN (tRNA processing enzyme)
VTTRELRANDRFEIGDITVTMARLNHPDPVYGYRLEHAGQSIVYATDTEHFSCVDPTLMQLAAGADILIYDAQYNDEEYATHRGWGHSTWREATRVARDAGVGRLFLFHLDPAHTDADVAEAEQRAMVEFGAASVAREGLVVTL